MHPSAADRGRHDARPPGHLGVRFGIPLALALAVVAALLAVSATTGAVAQSSTDGEPAPGEPIPIEPGPGGPVGVGRLAGPTRIDTAVAISQRAFPGGATVAYLANAAEPVDAITGGVLIDGPILLVGRCELPQVVADELARLAPDEVLALGGEAAVCDPVLFEASTAAAGQGGGDPGDQPDVVITTEVETIDPSTPPPFTVEAGDFGPVYEGGEFSHDITFTTGEASVTFDDPRFSGILEGDAGGRMAVAGRGCAPNRGGDGPVIACTDDFLLLTARPGEPATTMVRLYTDDHAAGDVQVEPGTYVLDQPIRWDADSDGDPAFDEGSAVIRVTYTVTAPSQGSDTGEDG